MKNDVNWTLSLLFKVISYILLFMLIVHLAFAFLSILNVRLPTVAAMDYIEFPRKIFWTDKDLGYGKLINGNLEPFAKGRPVNVLANEKDASDVLYITTRTETLTVKISNQKWIILLVLLKRMMLFSVLFLISHQLDKLFSSFHKEDPFNVVCLKRLRIIGLLIISLSPLLLFFNELFLIALRNYKLYETNTTVTHDLYPWLIIIGLIVFGFGSAFKIGTDLKNETELTI